MASAWAQEAPATEPVPADTVPADTIPEEATPEEDKPTVGPLRESYEPSTQPNYDAPDRYGDPFSNPAPRTPLYLSNPTQLDTDITVDSTVNYSIYERINGLDYRAPSYLNFEQYQQYQNQQMLRNYWRNRSAELDGESAVTGKRLIPPIYTTPIFDRLFGGSYVDIQPNGFVTLDFGGRFQRVENPAIPVRQQRTGNFEFDQQISLNVTGKIGDKLAVTANFDNNNSFDFQNDIKVEYTGYDHEIIKKIELGNVSLPVNNSLITGSQSLFGVKTQLQFGRLFVTSVASVQRGSSDQVTIENGSQSREFEIRASEYDENRHFFLGHFFRDNYEAWSSTLPRINSQLNVTRVEVYLINRTGNTETLRNIAAFMDLGESTPDGVYRDELFAQGPVVPTSNGANQLGQFQAFPRDPSVLDGRLQEQYPVFQQSTDYEIKSSARKLTEQEYVVNSQLGYISLNRKLQNDELLAVAYEYNYQGNRYKVGELTEDYQSLDNNQAIFLKLLRPTKINTDVPTWDLMMKNVYSLNANQITQEGFRLQVIYRDDRSGVDNPSISEGNNQLKDVPLVSLLGLDRLNQNNDPQPGGDGNFDFVPPYTIIPELGTIIFPTLEPFGSYLAGIIEDEALEERYVYNALYNTTKADAELLTTQNKYFLTGSFIAGSANEIMLPGINIAEGSVQVIAGNTPLTEGTDFTVDYNLGRVNILNEGVLSSGKEIRITYEKADLFNFQQRSLFGTRLDYKVNDNINFGATVLHLNERPVITRPTIGDEPTKNTKYGFDVNFQKDSRFLTRMVDALPLIQTKEPSTVTLNAEFAQLIPGTSNVINGDGTSYVDDFENFATPFSLSGWQNWQLGATPLTEDRRFYGDGADSLSRGYKRAKLAWYVVDDGAFYINQGGLKPDNIPGEIKNHYERLIIPQEVFPQQQRQTINRPLSIFDLAYFPEERGPYNYTDDLTPEGLLAGDPKEHWGGITRAITSNVDFDNTNVEYLEFWLLDPFIDGPDGVVQDGRVNQNNTTGGKLVFNLGNVSEDVIPDNRYFYENGLPEDYNDASEIQVTPWGRTPTDQPLVQFFSNESAEIRQNQDVGFDGVRNDQELQFYYGGQAPVNAISDDPSADNFLYYLDPAYDAEEAQIIERYKNFNGQENNTPFGVSNNRFTPSNGIVPDDEDANRDQTLNTLEEYYEYEVDLRPGQLEVGRGYIVDKVEPTDIPNAQGATWYLFRIPIRQPDDEINNPQGFKTIRYLRTYLTGFDQPVVLRFAQLQFVGSQWRRASENLQDLGLGEVQEEYDPKLVISAVNIEENSEQPEGTGGAPYRVPPGFVRDRDNTSLVERRVNEQSLQLCIEDLRDGDARAAFRNLNLDMVNYGNLRMFFHAEANGELPAPPDSTLYGFIRIGPDASENYYQIEIPLDVYDGGTEERDVWPEANEMDIELDWLHSIKTERNREGVPVTTEFVRTRGENDKYIIKVKGNPDLNTIQTVLIGVRNPATPDGAPYSVCVWANELRVGDFDRQGGWAVNARVNTKLADLANVTGSFRYTSFGFGGIQSKISDRTREQTTEYDVSANVNLDKFFPARFGVQIPMFVSYERAESVPQFDPRSEDVPLDAALNSFEDADERAEYLNIVTGQRTQRSLNFTNVRKVKVNEERPSRFYDLSNLTFSYLYSEEEASDFRTAEFVRRTIRGGVGYNYSFPDMTIEPFANMDILNSPWLALIKDFNFSPVPTSFSFRADINRSFVKTQYRNNNLTTFGIRPQYQKQFTFSRIYDLQWNLTRNLTLDYGARTLALIDEPDAQINGEINTEAERTYVLDQILNLGRMKNFDQQVTATYTVPLDKIPLTDWINADARYGANYSWQAGPFVPGQASLAAEPGDTVANNFNILNIGNTIQNSRERSVNGKVDMVGLYNKVKFLREANGGASGGRGRPARRVQTTNESDSTQQEEAPKESKFAKGFFRLLMSLRAINVTYTMNEGTILPGYRPDAYLFGLNDDFSAPGIPFLLGSQDPDIRFTAAENQWLTTERLTVPFQQSQVENLGIRADVEPFKDFRVQLDFNKAVTASYQEIFVVDYDSAGGPYFEQKPSRSGNYNISYLTVRTAFARDGADNNSAIFEEFEANRAVIRRRLETENPTTEAYPENAQDVLIPAFLAAYSGQDAEKINLSPFPRIPLPNWRIDYAGLPKLFPQISDAFPTLTISHAYTSTYSVSNYTSNLRYESGLELSRRTENYPQATLPGDSATLVPVYNIQQATISERFSPLIGINIRTKGSLAGRISYDRERSLSLNMSNAQVTELTSQGVTVNLGYTKKGLKLPFKVQGRTITLENDMTFNMAVGFKDTKTVQRRIEEDNTITNGNINFQVRPTVDYRVNERLNVQTYFARTINEPRITSSFRRTTTEFGVQVRYNLAQ